VCSRIVKILQDRLPPSLLEKTLVSLHSFGATEPLSRLTDPQWGHQQRSMAGWGWSNAASGRGNFRGGYSGGRGAPVGGRGGGEGSGGQYNRNHNSNSGSGGFRGGGNYPAGRGFGGRGREGGGRMFEGTGRGGYTGDKRSWDTGGRRNYNSTDDGQDESQLPARPPFAPSAVRVASSSAVVDLVSSDERTVVRSATAVSFSMEAELGLSDDSHDKRVKLRHSASAPDVAGRAVYTSSTSSRGGGSEGQRGMGRPYKQNGAVYQQKSSQH
jgi:hypothetical protein